MEIYSCIFSLFQIFYICNYKNYLFYLFMYNFSVSFFNILAKQ